MGAGEDRELLGEDRHRARGGVGPETPAGERGVGAAERLRIDDARERGAAEESAEAPADHAARGRPARDRDDGARRVEHARRERGDETRRHRQEDVGGEEERDDEGDRVARASSVEEPVREGAERIVEEDEGEEERQRERDEEREDEPPRLAEEAGDAPAARSLGRALRVVVHGGHRTDASIPRARYALGMPHRVPVALTIAGSDPSGGAGLQADLKTFHRHGVYGMSAVTLLTVQNTRAVTAVEFVTPGFLAAQLDALLDDIPPDVVKTGAIGRADLIEVVAERSARLGCPLVVDPVMVSKHGHSLLADDAVAALVRRLLPHAHLVTPNPAEASRLAGFPVVDAASIERAARAIADLGPRHVLVKGGRLPAVAADLLWSDGAMFRVPIEHLATTSTHGTGCTLSAAIAARLARGEAVEPAVRGACAFVHEAIRSAPGLGLGSGPVDHHAAVGPIERG